MNYDLGYSNSSFAFLLGKGPTFHFQRLLTKLGVLKITQNQNYVWCFKRESGFCCGDLEIEQLNEYKDIIIDVYLR